MKPVKYLFEDADRHGKTRRYYRRYGRKIRLRAEPGTPDFTAEYQAAEREALKPQRKTGNGGSFVYFITYGRRRVKIGTTINVRARLAELQAGIPGVGHIRYVTPGNRTLESELHKQFAPYRLNGEWFIFADAIRQWIKDDETRRITDSVGHFSNP